MLQFMFTSNFQQSSEKSQDEEVVRKRWRIESLVTCVQRHLHVDKAFTIMGRPTVEPRGSIVHSATNHSHIIVIWRPTSSFTLGRNRTSAHNATIQPIMLLLWECTLWNTLEKNHISAMNVTLLQLSQAIWKPTKGPTLGKSLTDALCASFPALQLVIWKGTWWGSTQEKNQTSVTNATTLAPHLVICRDTWRRTLGRSLSSATNAAKLTVERTSWQSIPEVTWRSRLRLLSNFEIHNDGIYLCWYNCHQSRYPKVLQQHLQA